MTREEYLEYCRNMGGVTVDQPFDEDFRTWVARHTDSRKWFALIFDVHGRPAVNLKCDPMLQYALLDGKSVFKAYHMNKEHWISVLLDGSLDMPKLLGLVDMSYNLIEKKTKKIKTKAPKYEDMW